METRDPHKKLRDKYKIDIKKYKIIKLIKKGGFGSVSSVQDDKGQMYAAKVVNCLEQEEDYKQMINREISIMMRIDHPTLVKFFGYSKQDFLGNNNITILMELLENGSLYDQIESARKCQAHPRYNNTARQIILIGIARGMMFLHQHHILHRDLKPGNILLDADFRPHIIDFGLSKFYESNKSKKLTKCWGTTMYMAPESIKNNQYSEKTDVYSFGILMFEVVTDQIPYPAYEKRKMTDFEFQTGIVNKNLRPKFEVPVKPSIRKLIERCWSKDPNKRPNFEEIYNKLAFSNDDWIIDVYDEKETENEYEVNKYFLEDVDVDEILYYVDDLQETKKSDFDFNEKIAALEKETKKQIENCNKEEINRLKKENKELKKIVSNLESLITVDGFNLLSLNSQKSIIEKAIVNSVNQKTTDYLNKVENLISHFLSFKKINDNHCFMIKSCSPNEPLLKKEEDSPIYLFSNLTKVLCSKKSFQLMKFVNLIKSFSKVYIEIDYPDDSFDSIFQQVVKFKKSIKNDSLIEISVFITDIKSVGNKFYMNNEINHVRIDSSVKNIVSQKPGVFEKCSSLKEVEIPSSLTEIGNRSFAGCSSLVEIKIPSSVTFIGSCAFAGCCSLPKIEIPSFLKKIESYSFASCSSLTSIIIPPSVTSIEEYAFAGCSSLSSILIPSSVTSIGIEAFVDCRSLTKIDIPPSVMCINSSTFKNCTTLKKVNIPSSVTKIDAQAFENCTALKKVNISSSVTKIGAQAFENCKALKKVSIPSSVKLICRYAFRNCTALKKVDLPPSVKNETGTTFAGCSSIPDEIIPQSLKKEEYTFDEIEHDYGLKSCPQGFVKVSSGALYDKAELRELLSANKNPICVITGKPLTEKICDFCPYLIECDPDDDFDAI